MTLYTFNATFFIRLVVTLSVLMHILALLACLQPSVASGGTVVLVALTNRLENLSRFLILLQRLGYSPLIGCSPGWLLAFLLKQRPEKTSIRNGSD